jgi:glycine dehydrogenase subunit 1
MSLLGASGLSDVAKASHANSKALCAALTAIPGIRLRFNSHYFHEFVIECPCTADALIKDLLKKNILAGLDLSVLSPELDHCLLICVTETKTSDDINAYVNAVQHALQNITSTSTTVED